VKTPRAWVVPALLLAVLIWGCVYSSIKYVQQGIPPTGLATLRAVFGAGVLLAILLARGGWPSLTHKEWRHLALLGLVGCTVFQLLLIWGLKWTTPSHSALLGNASPIFALLLAWRWLGEPLTWTKVAGFVLTFVGIIAILGGGPGVDSDASTFLGDVITLGSSLAWALFTVLGKPFLAHHPPLETTALALSMGALALLPFGAGDLWRLQWGMFSLLIWLNLAFLSLVGGLGYLLWYYALAHAQAGQVAIFSQLTPVVAVTLSVILGQDLLTVPLFVGAGAVIAGVTLTRLG